MQPPAHVKAGVVDLIARNLGHHHLAIGEDQLGLEIAAHMAQPPQLHGHRAVLGIDEHLHIVGAHKHLTVSS